VTERIWTWGRAAVAVALVLAGCSSPSADGTHQSSHDDGSTSPSTTQEPPPSLKEACFSTDRLEARSMWFRASDGVRLYGIESGTGRTAVVLAHEGGADLCQWVSYMETLNRAGIRTFAFDFRGNGNSEYPERARLALGHDLAGAVDQTRADGAKRVFLMGASMGGAAVVQNSADIRVDGLISLSGTRLASGYGINDPAGVRSLSAPLLYVGTRADPRVPRREAVSVFERVGSSDKRIVLYAGSAHGVTLVDVPPYGRRTRALILDWIASRS
jgi:uncharacterized protein